MKRQLKTPPDAERCTEIVFKRDTWRRTGRTKYGFEMHYTETRCQRRAVAGGLCTQHQPDYYLNRWKKKMAAANGH